MAALLSWDIIGPGIDPRYRGALAAFLAGDIITLVRMQQYPQYVSHASQCPNIPRGMMVADDGELYDLSALDSPRRVWFVRVECECGAWAFRRVGPLPREIAAVADRVIQPA